MKVPMRVWFNKTFSSVAAALGLIRQADGAGRFHLIYSNSNPHAAAARAAHAFALEPSGLDTEAYIAWCLDFCRQQAVDIFVPGKAATALAGQHARFAAIGTRVLSVAAQDQLELLHDKARFYAASAVPGAPVAEFAPFETVAQFDAAYATLRARHGVLCVKPADSVFGLGFAILDEQRSSAALLIAGVQYHAGLADFRRGLAELGSCRTMLLMQYLGGHEYSVDCVADHGRLVSAIVRKKPMTAGRGQLIDMRSDILDACRHLAGRHGLNGVFNVQFRDSSPGSRDTQDGAVGTPALHLLEINPRMSGGIGMACVAGPNLPWLALCGFADGFDGIAVPPVRDGIRVAELFTATELT